MIKLKRYLFNPMVECIDVVDKELHSITEGRDIPLGCTMYRSYDRWEFSVETVKNIPEDTLWKTLVACEAKIRVNNNFIDCSTTHKNAILNLDDLVICTYYKEATQVIFELLSQYDVSIPNNEDGEKISNTTCVEKQKIYYLVFNEPRKVNGTRYEEGVLLSINGKLSVISKEDFDKYYDIVIGG